MTDIPWYRATFGKLIIVTPIVAFLAAGIYIWSTEHRRASYDAAAETELVRLSAALKRLGNELLDANCSMNTWEQLSLKDLGYLIGPYYGWFGTNRRGKTLIDIRENEIRACSARGTWANGDKDLRRIYRISIHNLKELDPIVGPCTGRRFYPDGKTTYIYTSSMIRPGSDEGECTFEEPAGKYPY